MTKVVSRFATLLAAAMLALGVFAAPAFAEDATPIEEVPFNKTLIVGENTVAPNSWNFTFQVDPYTGSAVPTDGQNYDQTVFPGPAGGLAVPAAVTSGEAKAAGGATQNLAIDETKFIEPGIYRYTVKEVAGNVKGMNYDSTVHNVDLYVEYNSAGQLQVSNVIVFVEGGEKEGDAAHDGSGFSGIAFKNVYASAADNPDGLLHDVDVAKQVTGNQGDHTTDFAFTVEYNTQNNVHLMYKKGDGAWTEFTTGATITLKHGESFKIGGLAAGDTYTITETQQNGYKGKVTGDVTVAEQAAGVNVVIPQQTMAAADVAMTFTNFREGTIPTGVFLDYMPFWIAGAVMLVVAAVFLRKRPKPVVDAIEELK